MIYMHKKNFLKCILVSIVIILAIIPSVSSVQNNSGPQLDVKILPGPTFPTPTIKITNCGDESAHNVKIIDTDVNGKVIFNNRETNVADIIEPSSFKITSVNSWFFGFGIFNMTVYVSCDEGDFMSDTTNGIIIGSLILIL